VSESDKYAQALFGMAEFEENTTLQKVVDTWRTAHPKRSGSWIDALIDQIERAAQWQFPALRWTAMPTVSDSRLYAPVLTRVRKIPALASYKFDVYFYPFNLLDATPIQSRMVRHDDMLCRVLSLAGEVDVSLMDLLRELDGHQYSRIPFVDSDRRLVYIAHRSMLDQFVSSRARTGKISDLDKLTMADVFAEKPELRAMFSGTAAFVGSDATLAEAKAAMESAQSCYDVFVTDSGRPDEPVLGLDNRCDYRRE